MTPTEKIINEFTSESFTERGGNPDPLITELRRLARLAAAYWREIEHTHKAFPTVVSGRQWIRMNDNKAAGLFGGELIDTMIESRHATDAARREAGEGQ